MVAPEKLVKSAVESPHGNVITLRQHERDQVEEVGVIVQVRPLGIFKSWNDLVPADQGVNIETSVFDKYMNLSLVGIHANI